MLSRLYVLLSPPLGVPRRDPDNVCIEFVPGDTLALVHEATAEPAMLPPVVRGLMNPHHRTEHLQLPDSRPGRVDPEPRVGDEHVEFRVLDAEEDLDSTGGLVVGAEHREGFVTGRDSSEADHAASNAHASVAGRPKPLTREHAEVSLLRPTLDFRRTDLPLHPLNPTR